MSGPPGIDIIDIIDEVSFQLLPPCGDPRFDHRSCDYWEDEVRGSKSARPAWWLSTAPARPGPKRAPEADNPFAPPAPPGEDFNPFASSSRHGGAPGIEPDDLFAVPEFNPFAPGPTAAPSAGQADRPRKLRLLDRGRLVFGSYAKVLLLDGSPAAYAQFGPLSAYPRAQQIRELYPGLPQSPLPAVITCVATTLAARGQGLARRLVRAIVEDLAARGFAAIEAYPDTRLDAAEASAASPGFWAQCGFETVEGDERYPVMRIELA